MSMDGVPGGTAARPVDRGASSDDGPSFADRLLDAIRGLPLGGWWIYPVLIAFLWAWITGVRWLTGVATPDQIDLRVLAYFPYPVVALALLHYLDDVAEEALGSFAPALGGDAAAMRAWRRRLTSLPSRPTVLAAIAGLAFGALAIVQLPPSIYRQVAPDLPTVVVLVGWQALAGFALGAVLLYQSWRQLSAVSAIHAAATRIDPTKPEPLFSFARLTARTGLAYLGIVYYSVVTNGPTYAGKPEVLALNIIFGSFAVACFVLPLRGMHRRLAVAKADLLAGVESRFARVTGTLYAAVDADRLESMAEIDDAISSLTRVRAEVERLPTWPWSPALLRGFLTALLLPIVIWLITRVLENTLLA
ncbi:MAG TPA: hypothetical protein VFV53_07100 [Candidatus Limnocylindrales bacterium]|nr:hypothetical protein [Candidatus Limnocylindrales bacterium]